MSRWSPGYVPASLAREEPSFGDTLADAIEGYQQRKRQGTLDAQNDAMTAAKLAEAGIRPTAPSAPETPGTRLRGLLAALGVGHGPDGSPPPRATGPAALPSEAMMPAMMPAMPAPDLGRAIGGFAGGSLADTLARQPAGPSGRPPMEAPLPPQQPQPAPAPSAPVMPGASTMVGAFNPATGTFNRGAEALPPVQAVADAPPPPAQPPARPAKHYEPLSKGYEIETEDSRAQGQLYQQAVARQQKDAPNRAAHAALVSRFGHDQVGDYGEGMDYASLYDEMLKAETSRTEASARIAETHADRSSREAYQQGMLANGATQARASLLRAQQTGAGAGANRPPTDGERSAAGLLYEMKRGAERLKQFDNPEVLQRLASRGGMFTNWMNTPEGRQFDQAASQYIQNLIYAKSGKGITAEEARKLYGTYIRLPGDDAATAAAKRAAREEAEASVGIIAGRALPLVAETEARTGHGDANGARRALDPREKAEAQRNPKFQQFLASKGYGPGDWK